MNENDYLRQIAALTGLQYFPLQGPWGRKSGSVIGARDGYLTVIGFARDGNSATVAILLRFKKVAQPGSLKAALAESPSLPKKKPGKFTAEGADFVRWDWKYSFTKPKPDDVAKLADGLREALKLLTLGLDGRCEHCGASSTSAPTLMNGVPSYICSGCQEKIRADTDQAAMAYEALEPNHPNGLALGVGAALLGGIAWGLIAYGIQRIFLYGAILIGVFVARAVIKGTRKVTLFSQIIVPFLTVGSVLFGDAIYFALNVMKENQLAFSGKLLQVILTHLWELETRSGNFLSPVFGLVGAGYALYAARRPKFKTRFEPLGMPGT
jgi:hypothetical protein